MSDWWFSGIQNVNSLLMLWVRFWVCRDITVTSLILNIFMYFEGIPEFPCQVLCKPKHFLQNINKKIINKTITVQCSLFLVYFFCCFLQCILICSYWFRLWRTKDFCIIIIYIYFVVVSSTILKKSTNIQTATITSNNITHAQQLKHKKQNAGNKKTFLKKLNIYSSVYGFCIMKFLLLLLFL